MFYFLRTLLGMMILCVGLSLAITYGFLRSDMEGQQDDLRMPSTLGVALSNVITQPRDTYSGLLLAGISAQYNRDWVAARQFFDALSEKFSAGSANMLRSMSLSLGAGEYLQAVKKAHMLEETYLSQEGEEAIDERFDLARLLLISEALKNKNYDAAQSYADDLTGGAIAAYAMPIIDFWITAGQTPEQMTATVAGLSPLQIFYKAMAAEYAGRDDIAETLYDNVARRPLTAQTIETISAFYVRRNETDKAISLLNQGVIQFPSNSFISKSLKQLQDPDKDKYTAPDFADIHLQGPAVGVGLAYADFARLLASENAFDSALLFARLAAYMDEDIPGLAMVIGDILALQGQDDRALAAYRQVEPSNYDYIAAQIEAADILNDQGKAGEAIASLERLAETQPDALDENVYLTLGNLYKVDQQFQKAIEAYDIAEARALENAEGVQPEWLWLLYYFRGVSFDQIDQHDKAEEDLKRALELEPDNATLLNYLGYSYADNGRNLEDAYDMISRAVEQKPDDAYIVDSMGWVLYRMGRYAEAVEHLERAAELRPYNSVINDHLGDAYWQVGRRLEAHYMWRRAVDYIPDNGEEQLDADDSEQAQAAANAARKLETGLTEEDDVSMPQTRIQDSSLN